MTGCGGSAAPATTASSGSTATPAATTSATQTTSAAAPASAAPASAAPVGDLDGTGIASAMVMASLKAGSGSFDMKTTSTANGATVTMTGTSQYVVVNGAMDSEATMSFNGVTMDMINVGGVMYIKGMFTSKDGKPWVKIDPEGTDSLSKQLAPTLKQSADLRTQVEMYKGSTATLVDTVNGVRHYRLVGVAGAPTQPFDIYLDDQDRPVKVTTTSASMDMTVTYSGYGKPVTVKAPPASLVGPPPSM